MIADIQSHLKDKSAIEVYCNSNYLNANHILKSNPELLPAIELFSHQRLFNKNTPAWEVLDFMINSYFKLNPEIEYISIDDSIIKIPHIQNLKDVGYCVDIRYLFAEDSQLHSLLLDCICFLIHNYDFHYFDSVNDIDSVIESIKEMHDFNNIDPDEDLNEDFVDYIDEYTDGLYTDAVDFINNNHPIRNDLIKSIDHYIEENQDTIYMNVFLQFKKVFSYDNHSFMDYLNVFNNNIDIVFFVEQCHFSWNILDKDDPITIFIENDFSERCNEYEIQWPSYVTKLNEDADFSFLNDVLTLLKYFNHVI